MEACSAEKMTKNEEYWLPRIGEDTWSKVVILCLEDNDMYVQGEPTSLGFSSIIIDVQSCLELADPTVECATNTAVIDYWNNLVPPFMLVS